MAQMPPLDGAAIGLNKIREEARKNLVDTLDSVHGKKALILDAKLSGPLALVAQTSLLKEHGVEGLYHLGPEPLEAPSSRILFLLRPRIDLTVQIAHQIRADVIAKRVREYTVVFVPRRTIVCEKVLEDEGVYADVVVGECQLDFIPFDCDVLSLEHEAGFKECQVDGDRSSLFLVARALTRLQESVGVIPYIKGKGKAALSVAEMLPRMRRESLHRDDVSSAVDEAESPSIHTCILIDRQVDLATPLCTQLTYEGLIDELLHISNGCVEVDPTVMGAESSARKLKIPLNSGDRLFGEIRDVNFGAVGQILNERATSMKQDYQGVTTQRKSEKSVSDLKNFVKKLNSLPEITRHTNLAQHLSLFTRKPKFSARLNMEQTVVEGKSFESVLDYVEEAINKQEPILGVLRLLCLLSLTNSGLPKKTFDHVRRELVHSYGFEHILSLDNLEKAGFLKKQEGKGNWGAIKRGLRLVVDDLDDASPKDIAYTYSGYAPISIRLVQLALSKQGWQAADEVLRLLPGPHFERKQSPDGTSYEPASTATVEDRKDGSGRYLVLVVFLGGVTFAEISALRFLAAQDGSKHDFLVATTKLLNGNTLLQTLLEKSA